MAKTKGLFITFEGIEGSGKTLQISLLREYLSERQIPFVVTREPGGTGFGTRLRAVLLETNGPSRMPVAELLLYLADRYQDLAEVIEPALAAGKHVLCDRYHDATRAYQGHARGIELGLIDSLARALRIRRPDVTLFLDLPVRTGLRRARGRDAQEGGSMGRFEAESLHFHQRVREAYRTFAAREPRRFRVVPAAGSPVRVHRRIVSIVAPMLE